MSMSAKRSKGDKLYYNYLAIIIIIALVIIINVVIHSYNIVTVDTSSSTNSLIVSKKFADYFDYVNIGSVVVIICSLVYGIILTLSVKNKLERRSNEFSQLFSSSSFDPIDQAMAQNAEEENIILAWNDSVLEITRINEAREKYMKTMVHDFKMPIQLVRLNIDLFNLEYGENTYINQINDQVMTLNYDIMRILYLDRIKYFDKPNMTKLNLNLLLSEMMSSYNIESNIILKEEQQVQMVSDKDMLRKIFQNLIENGLKYKTSKYLDILIRSDCIEFRNEIDSFIDVEQLQSKERILSARGTGLGMKIIYEYAKVLNLNIEIKVENNNFIACIYFAR